MTVSLFTNFFYHTEIEDVAKLFFVVEKAQNADEADIVCTVWEQNDTFFAKTTFKGVCEIQKADIVDDKLHNIRLQKRFAKISIYNCLKKATNTSQAWGCLTGIRPTRLAYQLIEENGDFLSTFSNLFDVDNSKIQLVSQILEQQKGLLTADEKTVDLYISIPFCVTRCSYCSFTSGEIAKLKQFVLPYVDALCEEIHQTLDFAKRKGLKFKAVYIGGGTPTVLEAPQLKQILSTLKLNPVEFTVEAGRPDTITAEKFQLFADFNVNRVSVNPQTFNQRILDKVGRIHTVDDIYQKYYLAKKFNFDVNMDLIAGLPDEAFDEFCHSLNCAVELNPQNITVHTLALKKGSILKIDGQTIKPTAIDTNVPKMVEYSYQKLIEQNFRPYYMYRQKYMTQNLENVGYCKPKKACLYNIDNMEETTSILACGASAISKRVFIKENRIERSANPKDVKTYLENHQHFIDQKLKLF